MVVIEGNNLSWHAEGTRKQNGFDFVSYYHRDQNYHKKSTQSDHSLRYALKG